MVISPPVIMTDPILMPVPVTGSPQIPFWYAPRIYPNSPQPVTPILRNPNQPYSFAITPTNASASSVTGCASGTDLVTGSGAGQAGVGSQTPTCAAQPVASQPGTVSPFFYVVVIGIIAVWLFHL